MDIHGGKTMLTFLDKEKEYKLYDEQNRVAEKKKGEELYQTHYDPVEMNLRQRAEKQKKAEERKRTQQKLKAESEKRMAESSKGKGR